MTTQITDLQTVYQGYCTILRARLVVEGEPVTREIEHHGRAAAVLPYDPERRTALLVSLPRAPVIWAGGPERLAEAPAGMVEGEGPEDCARREALEEAGVKLGALERVGAPFSSPGFTAERIDLFLAPYSAADRVAEGGGAQGEHEHIRVEEVPLDALWTSVAEGRLDDMKTLALVLSLRVRRPDLFGS